ncbi:uncharacterized protein AFUA_3G01720 [Aspergillus fumigatus Af293]|uniref:Uncharacterized protein n=2 Tax=Aspergillus fumigatus TaxID=746128 RepID=Q4WFM2_ASPFU|nr:hypothetical protein AFUA_3G01720 [Aspergillus fumigatus Af293]EAL86455.1 hypothetical protein AFUA_3G01720 [Aspergillus fumigatus Af293]EDP53489.1 hypothetical protein AFUB_046680 [Aspergillus fumigatus A1163]
MEHLNCRGPQRPAYGILAIGRRVMQPVVREEFASKTMITVAHRLRTILVVIWW